MHPTRGTRIHPRGCYELAQKRLTNAENWRPTENRTNGDIRISMRFPAEFITRSKELQSPLEGQGPPHRDTGATTAPSTVAMASTESPSTTASSTAARTTTVSKSTTAPSTAKRATTRSSQTTAPSTAAMASTPLSMAAPRRRTVGYLTSESQYLKQEMEHHPEPEYLNDPENFEDILY
jgi:hypothetical protein